jgi:hypothetical protein
VTWGQRTRADQGLWRSKRSKHRARRIRAEIVDMPPLAPESNRRPCEFGHKAKANALYVVTSVQPGLL